jgi:hypothetical protein
MESHDSNSTDKAPGTFIGKVPVQDAALSADLETITLTVQQYP